MEDCEPSNVAYQFLTAVVEVNEKPGRIYFIYTDIKTNYLPHMLAE